MSNSTFNLSSLNNSSKFGLVFNGISERDRIGLSTSSAGDFNGDGVDDIIIAAPYVHGQYGWDTGQVYVVFGKTNISSPFNLSNINGINGIMINGIGTIDYIGNSVASLGDINGDNKSDIIIGTTNNDYAYIIFGSNSLPNPFTVSSLNGINGFIVNGAQSGDLTGYSVSPAGDFNGDGRNDIIINAPGYSLNTTCCSGWWTGRTYIIFGKNSYPNPLNLAAFDSTSGIIISGWLPTGSIDRNPVGSIGDFNGDGRNDILIGAPFVDYNQDQSREGQVYIIFGSPNFPSQFSLSNLNSTYGLMINGRSNNGIGWSASPAGDINNDGKSDIMIGARYGNDAYIVFGSANLTSPLQLTNLNSTTGIIINGGGGRDVSLANDINGDGKPDLLIGSSYGYPGPASPSNNNAGQSYIIFTNPSLPSSFSLSNLANVNSIIINGIAGGFSYIQNYTTFTQTYYYGDDAGWSISYAGDFNGDGKKDIIIGAPWASPDGKIWAGQAYILYAESFFMSLPNVTTTTSTASSTSSTTSTTTSTSISTSTTTSSTEPTTTSSTTNVTTQTTSMANLFANQVTYTVGAGNNRPFGVAIADVNLDGRPDTVVTNYDLNTLSVLLGTSSGFAAQVTYAVGIEPYNVAIYDVNLDGKPDIVATNWGSNTVSVLLGNLTSFATQSSYAVGSNPIDLAIDDVNLDGWPDIVTANSNPSSNTVSVLLGTSSGFAAQTLYAASIYLRGLVIADVNLDGWPDIVTISSTSATLSVLLGTLNGFAAPIKYAVYNNAGVLAIADVNLDGWPDTVAANYASNTILVLLGGSSGFSGPVSYAFGSTPHSIAISDINLDGRLDIATVNANLNTISILLGTSNGFSVQGTYAVGSNPIDLAIADVNLDGRPDIIVTNAFSADISVLLNIYKLPCVQTVVALFANQTTYAVGISPIGVAIADVNLDGRPDIVTSNGGTNTVSVLLGTLSGFAAQVTYAVGNLSERIVIGDVNLDGRPDIVTPNYNSNTISVLLGTSSGFAAQVTYAVGSAPFGIAIGDVNLDGRPDIITTNTYLGIGQGTVSILLGTSTGFATQVTYLVGSDPRGVAIKDVNLDGKPDIIIANSNSATVSVLLGTSSGFANKITYSVTGVDGNPESIVISDVNLDGRPDIVTANSDITISVLLGTLSGFATPTTYAVGNSIGGIAIGDVNLDGRPDIVVTKYGDSTVSVLLGTLNGFAEQTTYTVGNYPEGVAIADVNLDGKPDIVTANLISSTISVLLNTYQPVCLNISTSTTTPTITTTITTTTDAPTTSLTLISTATTPTTSSSTISLTESSPSTTSSTTVSTTSLSTTQTSTTTSTTTNNLSSSSTTATSTISTTTTPTTSYTVTPSITTESTTTSLTTTSTTSSYTTISLITTHNNSIILTGADTGSGSSFSYWIIGAAVGGATVLALAGYLIYKKIHNHEVIPISNVINDEANIASSTLQTNWNPQNYMVTNEMNTYGQTGWNAQMYALTSNNGVDPQYEVIGYGTSTYHELAPPDNYGSSNDYTLASSEL